MQKLFDWFVPPSARGNAMLEVRYRGVAQALLAISGVVALLAAMWALLSGGILSPSAPWMLALMAVWAGFGDRRFVIWAGTIVALCTAGLYAATINAWLPPSMMRTEQLPLYGLLSLLFATALLTVTALASQVERERVKRRLREARAQAGQSSRAKSVFLASISHKFRTPLNSVIGFAEVLSYQEPGAAADPLTAEQRDYVNQIVEAGNQLLALVNQALDMSQIESGSFVVEWNRVAPATEIEAALAYRRHRHRAGHSGCASSRHISDVCPARHRGRPCAGRRRRACAQPAYRRAPVRPDRLQL